MHNIVGSFSFFSLLIVMFLCLLIIIYAVIKTILKLKKEKYISKTFDNINSKYEERLKIKEARKIYEGETEEDKFIEKIDNLIVTSGIRIISPYLTSEIVIVLSIFSGFAVSFITYKLLPIYVVSVFSFFATIVAIVLLLNQLARSSFQKIDDQLLVTINSLRNAANTNDDLIKIFESSLGFMDEPLKSYTQQFLNECKAGIPLEKAIKNFQDRVESKRFKKLLGNLFIASKHAANYKSVLTKSAIICKSYEEVKVDRREKVRDGRMEIVVIIILGIVMLYMISGLMIDLREVILNTTIGNGLLGVGLAFILYSVYTLLTLDKFNY